MAKLFLPHTLSVNGTAINCKISESFERQTVINAPLADGDIQPTHQAITSQQSMYRVQTYNIPAAIGLTGTMGASIGGAVTWYDAEMDAGGAKKSGTEHVRGQLAAAYVYPESISVKSKGVAVMSFVVMGIASGDSATYTAGVSLAGTPGTTIQMGMRGLYINNTVQAQIRDFTLNFGVGIRPNDTDGNIGIDDAKTDSARPVASFTCTDANLAATVGSSLTLDGTNGLEFYLGQYVNRDGSYSASGAVLIQLADGVLLHNGTSDRSRTGSYRAEGAAGSSNAVVITTGASLP